MRRKKHPADGRKRTKVGPKRILTDETTETLAPLLLGIDMHL
jgi:hypothetical protein